jgi:hypothetical protein
MTSPSPTLNLAHKEKTRRECAGRKERTLVFDGSSKKEYRGVWALRGIRGGPVGETAFMAANNKNFT